MKYTQNRKYSAKCNGSAMADFRSEELSHGHNRFQHIKYYGKLPELNDFKASSEILGGTLCISFSEGFVRIDEKPLMTTHDLSQKRPIRFDLFLFHTLHTTQSSR